MAGPVSYVMKVSAGGQVTIPADARSRWNADRVVVVDLGDHVVVRPMPPEPISSLRGKYAGRGAPAETPTDEPPPRRRRT
jgi:bifunctional DNA-binding transcriptional regulator/antitoxin component of YhaV-PrlF toxin-antitoxin module